MIDTDPTEPEVADPDRSPDPAPEPEVEPSHDGASGRPPAEEGEE